MLRKKIKNDILYAIPLNTLFIYTPAHYLHAINTFPSMSSQALRKLLKYFDTPEEIWKSSPSTLKASGISEKMIESILLHRPSIDINAQWNILESSAIRLITVEDAAYPLLLKEIHNPPFILYTRGNFDYNSKPLITIVGSRHASPYGERVAQVFASELTAAGIAVASGLAFGIDKAAHIGTLETHGTTIAVLGNSLDNTSIAPHSHLPLAHAIISQGGALLSEYPPITNATPFTFPARNRILAGISAGTIVIEAARKSGSLITARYALESNREVFAVPGSIFSDASQGPHDLIRSGAKIATSIQDILEEVQPIIHPAQTSTTQPSNLSADEEHIYALLSGEPLHIDKILKTTTLETSQVQSVLVFLEVKGHIKNMGGMHYIRL